MKKNFTLSNVEIVDAAVALNALALERIPVVAGFIVAKNRTALKLHMTEYESYRQKILDEYGHHDHNGNLIQDSKGEAVFVSPDRKDAAVSALNELGALQVEVALEAIAITALSNINVQPALLGALLWMFTEGENEP
jgi:hypothetical protein